MNRREFLLGSLAVTLTAINGVLLPDSVLAESVPDITRWNTETLTNAIENRFKCSIGPAQAFYEVQTSPTTHSRYVYITYGASVEGGSAQEAEARLAKHFYNAFMQIERTELVWRKKPEFTAYEQVDYGDTYYTSEQIEDFGHPDIYPEDAEFDINTNSYRYVIKKTPVYRMRMRLVFPELVNTNHPLASLEKPEGEFIKRINHG